MVSKRGCVPDTNLTLTVVMGGAARLHPTGNICTSGTRSEGYAAFIAVKTLRVIF